MRKALTLGLGILSFLVFTIPARYIYVCKIKNNCGPTTVVESTARPFSLSLMDGDSVILTGYEQLSFDNGSTAPDLTLNNQEFLDKIADYIKANPDKNLTITGLFRNSENGVTSGMFENLGLARSNILRDFLVQRGIDVSRISLDHSVIPDDNLTEPAKFDLSINTPEEYDNDTNGKLSKAQFRFDDMTFSEANFEYNSDVFKPGTAFNVWADSVQIYFTLNTDKALNIIGHTDASGREVYNKGLGLRRAQSAKNYFIEKGVAVAISTESKGEQEPIATNATPAGMQKNRRVNFVIK